MSVAASAIIAEERRAATELEAANSALEAARLLRRTQRNGGKLTKEDREIIDGFMGWGYAQAALDTRKSGTYLDINRSLTAFLGKSGTLSAFQSAPTSHYTSPLLADTLWKVVTDIGVTRARVLEIGIGTGAVIAAAPKSAALSVTGVEKDEFTAQLARLRLPNADIVHGAIEDTSLPDQYFDLVIGNVPFSEISVADRAQPVRFNLHNYCIWRGLNALAPGGILGVITSRYTMDAIDSRQREEIAKLGEFVGALRLPNNAHSSAHTKVVTDMVFFRRRDGLDNCPNEEQWLHTQPTQFEGIQANEYWTKHPELICGTLSASRDRYADPKLDVIGSVIFSRDLERASDRLSMSLHERGITWAPKLDVKEFDPISVQLEDAEGRQERSFHIINSKLCQIVDSQAEPIPPRSLGIAHQAELAALTRIRDDATELLRAEENFDTPDEDLAPLRNKLNASYDAYIQRYGYLSRSRAADLPDDDDDLETNDAGMLSNNGISQQREQLRKRRAPRRQYPALRKFHEDPDYATVMSLEMWDASTQTATKSSIFTTRVNAPLVQKTKADTPDEAVALCMDQLGKFDLSHASALLQIPQSATEREKVQHFKGLIFHDPESGEYEAAAYYLSGNVRNKLAIARQHAQDDPDRYQQNVLALEAVIPEDLTSDEIVPILGANWISPSDIEDFSTHLFGNAAQVTYDPVLGTWSLKAEYYQSHMANATQTWGTPDRNGYELLLAALNKSDVSVYRTDRATKKRTRDHVASVAAEEKLTAIKEAFDEWIWLDPVRTDRLCRTYNDLYNSHVATQYNGKHLLFPGLNPTFAPRDYQSAFVDRVIHSPSALADHPVGFGKTATMMMSAMKLRQYGFCNTALIITPNQLLEQITASCKTLYPNANVLMATVDDLSSKKARELFAARVATGKYDVVVMTHSAFRRLPLHPDTQRVYIEREIDELMRALANAKEAGTNSFSTKEIGKQINRLEERLKSIIQRNPADDGVSFEQLGIDAIFVDESHMYKNLGVYGVEGISVPGSIRANDLYMKSQWLREKTGNRRSVYFFSGTPITNTIFEEYTLERYLNPDGLAERGIHSAQAWANNHASLTTQVEVGVDGQSFKLKRRLSSFHNVPVLQQAYKQFADSIDPSLLDHLKPKFHRITVISEMPPALQPLFRTYVDRAESITNRSPVTFPDGRDDNMLWVASDGRAAAVHPRLADTHGDYAIARSIAGSESPKVNDFVEQFLKLWRYAPPGHLPAPDECPNLQIAFCDRGTPNGDDEGVYGIIREKLVERGVPRSLIRFIHEANTDAERSELFAACRARRVALLLGSTEKLGTGVNIQDYALAVHHIDPTWRTDGIEQRAGRVWRPGNNFPHVLQLTYITQKTFDAFSWQTLDRKARQIAQFRSTGQGALSIAEIDAATVPYAEIKAATTGDRLLIIQAQLRQDASKLRMKRSAHLQARQRAHNQRDTYLQQASWLENRAALCEHFHREMADQPKDFIAKYGMNFHNLDDISDFLRQETVALKKSPSTTRVAGKWRGLDVQLLVCGLKTELRFSAYSDKLISFDEVPYSANERQSYIRDVDETLRNLDRVADEYRAKAEHLKAEAKTFDDATTASFANADELEHVEALLEQTNIILETEARVLPHDKAEAAKELAKRRELRETFYAAIPDAQEEDEAASREREEREAREYQETLDAAEYVSFDAVAYQRALQERRASREAEVASAKSSSHSKSSPETRSESHSTQKLPRQPKPTSEPSPLASSSLTTFPRSPLGRFSEEELDLFSEFNRPAEISQDNNFADASDSITVENYEENVFVLPTSTEEASDEISSSKPKANVRKKSASLPDISQDMLQLGTPDYEMWQRRGTMSKQLRTLVAANELDDLGDERHMVVAVGRSGKLIAKSRHGDLSTTWSIQVPRIEQLCDGYSVLVISRHDDRLVLRNPNTNAAQNILAVVTDDERSTMIAERERQLNNGIEAKSTRKRGDHAQAHKNGILETAREQELSLSHLNGERSRSEQHIPEQRATELPEFEQPGLFEAV